MNLGPPHAPWLDLLPEPTLLLTTSGAVLAANAPARRLGLVPGIDLVDLAAAPERARELLRLASRSRSLVPATLSLRLKDGDPWRADLRVGLVEPAGTSGPALLLARVVQSTSGFVELNRQLEMLRVEVGRRVESEQRLRDARAELAAVLDAARDSIFAFDAMGRFRFANAAGGELVGSSSPEELAETSLGALVDRFEMYDEDGGEVLASDLAAVRALAGEAAEQIALLRRRADNHELWTHTFAAPVFSAGGEVRLVVAVIRDITAQRRQEIGRRFLLDATAVLASSLDLQPTLDRVAELAVPRLADLSIVRLFDERGDTAEMAVAHRDPELVTLVREAAIRFPADPNAPYGFGAVLRTGEATFVPAIDDSILGELALNEQHLDFLRKLRVRSGLIVPIKLQGRTIGGIALLRSESPRPVDAHDLEIAEALADRVGVAIDNARLYQAIDTSRERLAVTLSSIGDGVVSTDARGRVEFLNPVAEVLTGWKQEQARSKPLDDVFRIFREGTGQRVETPVERVLRTGRIVGLANHTELEGKDGVRRAIADSAAPIRARSGEVAGVVLVFRDVTQQRRLEDEVVRASKLDSVGVLAGGIAHDFNNILTAITANVAFAEARLPEEHPVKRRLAAASTACQRAADLTRQLLTFAKGGAPVKASTALPELLRDTSAFALQGSRSRLDLRVQPDLWPVEADAGQISQVVQNLVINADQAMTEGGVVRVSATNVVLGDEEGLPLASGRYVRIAVQDQGPGIPAENLERVFDPFFSTKAKGTGLGLATSYSIVRRHDGHIGVESRPGRGARFVVHLPASDAAPVAATREPEPPRGSGRVLIMDDEAAIRELASLFAMELGYEAATAHDGSEALALYRDAVEQGRPYDVVLLDLTVPGAMGGQEALARLRELDPEVRAIVSSGYSNDPVLARFREHGFAGVLQKPYRLEDLARVLAEVLAA